MNKTFFARFALPILMLVFFAVPFALRGARFAFSTMKNDVKDWLPANFDETRDLDWFRANFLGEQFVLVTWPGCTADDTHFKMMVEKLQNELHTDETTPTRSVSEASSDTPTRSVSEDSSDTPTRSASEDSSDSDAADQTDEATAALATAKNARDREHERNRQMADRLGLSTTGDYRENWGGQDEKWLLGDKDQWYYLTPAGELYRWDGGNNLLGWASRKLERTFTGKNTASGELVATVGEEYWKDPRRLTARFFKTVTTGPQVLNQLAGPNGPLWPRGNYSDEEKVEIANKLAHERLSGALFGPDGKQTCMIVTLSEVGRRDLKRVLGRSMLGKPEGKLLQIAREAGLSYQDLRLGGPPVDNVAIDEEGSVTLVRLIGWSLLVGVSLAYLSFRSFKITFMIFFVGGVSAIFSLSFVWFAGDFVDAIVMSMPSLVYVLGLTSAVHMLTYYRHHASEHGLEGAAEATILHTWKPLLLAQFTSALGLLSLLTSELSPIRKFGYYSALGTIATLVIMYLYLPSALQLWPPGYHRRRTGETTDFENWFNQLGENFWGAWSSFVVRNHYWVAPAVGILVIVVGYGAVKLKTNVHLLKMFDADAKIIKDYAWLENNLGRLVPMEIALRIRPEISQPLSTQKNENDDARPAPLDPVKLNFLERMEIADFVQKAVEDEFGENGQQIVGKGMSAATFAPPIPKPGSGFLNARRVVNSKLEAHRDEYLNSDYLRIDKAEQHAGCELWRVSLRLGALNNVDYGEFVNDLKSVVEPVMAAVRYREATLRQVLETRGDQGLTGARIAVIGLSDPKSYDEIQQPAKNDVAGGKLAITPVSASQEAPAPTVQPGKVRKSYAREQDRIFAQTFADLLESRGFRTTSSAKSKLEFLDAEALQDESGKRLSGAALADKLKGYSCVVFARELPGLTLAAIKQHNPNVIDAHEYRFDSYEDKTKPGANQPSAKRADDQVQAIYTGVVPVVYKAQRTLLDSLVTSTKYAFVSIAGCLMILLRKGPIRPWNLINFRAGLVAMMPNMFPLIIVFGAIGWLGIEVDIGSMMTASIAIGVAVDDTIHYLEFFRKEMLSGKTRREAIVEAYRHTGSAIIETMLIGGFGLSVFAFSTFTPTQRFGTMMLTMLAVGAAGELIWMPALLAGPLGKYFEPLMPQPAPAPATFPATESAVPAPHDGLRDKLVRRDSAH